MKNKETVKMDMKTVAQKYSDYQVQMRRYFHQHPELSEKEFNTSKVIKEELDKIGVSWVHCGLQTGILATIKGEKPGKTILLRGDIDALSVTEDTGLPFTSENTGVMHACGHDCHISMMLTAAHILQDMRKDLCGTVKLAFQPAEEVATGAPSMIEQGALEGVDGCFAIHVWFDVDAGHVCCDAGPRMGGANKFTIDIKGRGGHAATPQECIDAAVVQAAVISNLQTLVSRNFSPMDPVVVTVGEVTAGERWNVVAENAHLAGTSRCFSKEINAQLPKLIDRVASETAAAFGAKATTKNIVLCPPVINDQHMAQVVQGAAREVIGSDAPVSEPGTMGGEDFAFFMDKVPGAVALLGIRNPKCGAIYPQHSCHYTVDESALLGGAMLYAKTAMDFNAGK